MSRFSSLAVLGLAGTLVASVAFAQGVEPDAAHRARESHMMLMAANLGILGGMAQDKTEYDAEAAAAAASNLAAISGLDQFFYWPEGSEQGAIEDSRALPAIWENMDDFMAKRDALHTAAMTLAQQAGTDLDSLKAAFGPVGQACAACHETYRAPE